MREITPIRFKKRSFMSFLNRIGVYSIPPSVLLCSASKLIIALPCRYNVAIDAINIIKLPSADFRGDALVADEIMLGKAILIDADNRCRIQGVVTVLMEGNSLRCAVDIHAFHRSMTLDNPFAAGVVGIATGLAVVRKHHQPVILVPVHLARLARRVIRYC